MADRELGYYWIQRKGYDWVPARWTGSVWKLFAVYDDDVAEISDDGLDGIGPYCPPPSHFGPNMFFYVWMYNGDTGEWQIGSPANPSKWCVTYDTPYTNPPGQLDKGYVRFGPAVESYDGK